MDSNVAIYIYIYTCTGALLTPASELNRKLDGLELGKNGAVLFVWEMPQTRAEKALSLELEKPSQLMHRYLHNFYIM